MPSAESNTGLALLPMAVLCGCANYVSPSAFGSANSTSSSVNVSDADLTAHGIAGLRIEERTDGSAIVTFAFVGRDITAPFEVRMGLPVSRDFFLGAPMNLPDEPTSTAWVSYVARPRVSVSRSIVAATYRRDPRQRFRLTLTLGVPRPAQEGAVDARLGEVTPAASGFMEGTLEVQCFARGGPPITVSPDGGPAETTYALQYDPTVVTRFCRSTLTSLGLLDP